MKIKKNRITEQPRNTGFQVALKKKRRPFRSQATLVALSFIMLLSTTSLFADDWPTFMGNGARTGFSTEPGRTISGLEWIYNAGGMILSSPVAAGGVVYAGCNDGSLHAVDAAAGSLLWTFPTDAWFEGAPAVSEGVVYAGAMDRKLYAIAASDGSELWSYETSGWIQGSPLVAGGVVYVGSMDHHVYALDAATGALIWKYKTGGFISAALSLAPGTDLLIVASNDGMVSALDRSTGLPAWTYDTGGFMEAAPVCGDGRICIAVSDNAEINDESIDNMIMAVDPSTGSVIWRLDLEKNDMVYSTPALSNGTLAVATFTGAVVGLDAAAGTEIWRNKPDDFAYFASLAATDDMIVAQDLDSRLYVLDPSDGAIRQVFGGPGEIYSSAAISDGKIYTATTQGYLIALSISP